MSSFKTKSQKRLVNNTKCLSNLIALVLIVSCVTQANGQFFTKSSSKSIPRMGRRSISADAAGELGSQPVDTYKRPLIDMLLDQYGPSLLQKLEEAKQHEAESTGRINDQFEANGDSAAEKIVSGRQSLGNLIGQRFSSSEQPIISDNSLDNPLRREERSSTTPTSSRNQPNNNYRDVSLAMRALNADRYIRHLASGQPLTSFEGLFSGGGGGTSGWNNADSMEQRVQQQRQQQQQANNGVAKLARHYLID